MSRETNSHPSRSCALTRARLPLFTGGDLEGKALEEVRAHLGRCEACAEAAAGASRARAAFVAALRAPAAALDRPGLWPGVRARLVEEGVLGKETPVLPFPSAVPGPDPASSRGAGSFRPRLLRRSGGLRRLAGYAAAAAAIIFLVVLADPWGLRGDGVLVQPGPKPGPFAAHEEIAELPAAAPRGLRRISAEEEAALDAVEATRTVPRVRSRAALVGDSHPLGYR